MHTTILQNVIYVIETSLKISPKNVHNPSQLFRDKLDDNNPDLGKIDNAKCGKVRQLKVCVPALGEEHSLLFLLKRRQCRAHDDSGGRAVLPLSRLGFSWLP